MSLTESSEQVPKGPVDLIVDKEAEMPAVMARQ